MEIGYINRLRNKQKIHIFIKYLYVYAGLI